MGAEGETARALSQAAPEHFYHCLDITGPLARILQFPSGFSDNRECSEER